MPLGVATTQVNGSCTVALSGELDLATASSAEESLLEIEGGSPARLVLDLRALRFMDSTGLSLLINADRRGRKAGRSVTVVSGTGPPRRILRTVGLDTRLDVVEDLPVAAG